MGIIIISSDFYLKEMEGFQVFYSLKAWHHYKSAILLNREPFILILKDFDKKVLTEIQVFHSEVFLVKETWQYKLKRAMKKKLKAIYESV